MKIIQRKPEPEQDESVYSTSIRNDKGLPVAIGYGVTQEGADTNCLVNAGIDLKLFDR